MAMNIDPESGGRVAVVRLATDPRFTADLDAVNQLDLAKPSAIVLDFTLVQHINSSNLSKLLRLRKRLIEEEGKLILCGLNPGVAGVFGATGLDRVFALGEDLQKSIAWARGSRKG